MLNSVYGMSVTDPVKDTATYSEDWGVEPIDLLEAVDKILEEMHLDGTMTKISEKWLDGVDISVK